MINHIVIWRFKEAAAGKTKLENIEAAVALLDGCRDLVPGIERFEIVRGVAHPACTSDLMLVSAFSSQADLDAYQTHPTHQALKPLMADAVAQRECMDYPN